jgi:hypothetical protein
MCAVKIGDKGDDVPEQLTYLSRLSRKSLVEGETSLAMEQIKGCIRMVHGLRNSKTKRRLIDEHAVIDHWRLGCCHASLGPEHHGKALGHLNVVRRYCKWMQKKRRLELDDVQTVTLCRALAAMARIFNQRGQYEQAMECADEGLDALYRNEELEETAAADLVQMLCFSARGDALKGLGHCGEVVVRHYEQVMLHYRRHVSSAPVVVDRNRLIRMSKGCWPWANDRIYPETTIDRAAEALRGIRKDLSSAMLALADAILKEHGVWRNNGA